MQRTSALLCALTAGLVLGCSHQPYQPNPASDEFSYGASTKDYITLLEKQAPFDMSCDPDQLVYKDLGRGTVGVTGCDRRATYKFVGGAGWVTDTFAEKVE